MITEARIFEGSDTGLIRREVNKEIDSCDQGDSRNSCDFKLVIHGSFSPSGMLQEIENIVCEGDASRDYLFEIIVHGAIRSFSNMLA